MIHEELLVKINAAGAYALQADSYGWIALRAVVELHKPTPEGRYDDDIFCENCSRTELRFYVFYPCPTIQAIEKELR